MYSLGEDQQQQKHTHVTYMHACKHARQQKHATLYVMKKAKKQNTSKQKQTTANRKNDTRQVIQ